MATAQPTIGDRIRGLRTYRGLTQQELATASGLAQGLISKWEANEQQPSVESAMALARAFRITMDELCGMLHEAGAEPLRSDVGPLNATERRLVRAYRHDDHLRVVFRTILNEYAPEEP